MFSEIVPCIEINPIQYESYQNLMKSVTYWWIFLYKLRWKRKSNHLDNQDILFAFMNIASKSNPLKPLKCTLRKKVMIVQNLKTISTIEVTSDRGLFQCEVTHTIFKMKNPAKNTCTMTYARYDMLHIRCINSNSWECNFQRSKNLKRSPLEFKLHDRWAWIGHHLMKSIYFFQIVFSRSYTWFRRSWIWP